MTFDRGGNDSLVFVVSGSANAYASDGTLVIEARPGTFLAESSLSQAMVEEEQEENHHDDDDDDVPPLDYASASSADLVCLVWPVEKLAAALKRDEDLRDAFRQALAVDLCRKIVRESQRNMSRASFASSSSGGSSTRGSLLKTLYGSIFGPSQSGDFPRAPERLPSLSVLSPAAKRVSLSLRARRKGSVRSVMKFVNSGSKRNAERVKMLDAKKITNDGYDAVAPAQNQQPHIEQKKKKKKVVPTRRPSKKAESNVARARAYAQFANVSTQLCLSKRPLPLVGARGRRRDRLPVLPGLPPRPEFDRWEWLASHHHGCLRHHRSPDPPGRFFRRLDGPGRLLHIPFAPHMVERGLELGAGVRQPVHGDLHQVDAIARQQRGCAPLLRPRTLRGALSPTRRPSGARRRPGSDRRLEAIAWPMARATTGRPRL